MSELVIVTFDGLEHPGVVESKMGKGWVRCRIRIDPAADYGAKTASLGVESVVCVRESDIRPADSVGNIT